VKGAPVAGEKVESEEASHGTETDRVPREPDSSLSGREGGMRSLIA
jgi:hypothetical protein